MTNGQSPERTFPRTQDSHSGAERAHTEAPSLARALRSRAGRMMRRMLRGTGLRIWDPLSKPFWSQFYFAGRAIFRGYELDVPVGNLVLRVDTRDISVGWSLRRTGIYEVDETALLTRLLKPGMTFVDVGANLGYHTTLAAKLVGSSGHVFAFEPEPYNFHLLTINVERNGFSNVTLENVAVTDRSGELTLFLSRANFGDHRIKEGSDTGRPDEGRVRQQIKVKAVPLDDYFKHDTVIDVIKMDIQGAEGGAFAGMRHLLNWNPNVVVVTEFWPHGLRQQGTDPKGLLDTVTSLGFRIFEICDGPVREVEVDSLMARVWNPLDEINIALSRMPLV